MKQLSFHPQVSPNWNKNEKFDGSHYIETVDIAKIIKMGSLHASQKWSFSEKKKKFGLNYQNSWWKLQPRAKRCNLTIFELPNEIGNSESLWSLQWNVE
jgi:hypothetical protein